MRFSDYGGNGWATHWHLHHLLPPILLIHRYPTSILLILHPDLRFDVVF